MNPSIQDQNNASYVNMYLNILINWKQLYHLTHARLIKILTKFYCKRQTHVIFWVLKAYNFFISFTYTTQKQGICTWSFRLSLCIISLIYVWWDFERDPFEIIKLFGCFWSHGDGASTCFFLQKFVFGLKMWTFFCC